MDCCKAISMAAVYEGDIWNDFWARPGVIDFEPIPLGMIVTVAGTGSEMNGGAVITNEELKIKTGRDYPKCNARFALMDPTYTYSVPEKQMVSGGFDILSHIMETYFSEPDEDNVSDDISEALMRGVIRDLRATIQNPEDYIAAATGADTFELVPVEPYTDADLNYNDDSSRVVYEHDNPDARTVELVESTVSDWESYDTVFIGYPIWWGIAAWPVDNFVKEKDFSGKTVIPFATSSSSGMGESGTLLEEMAGTGDWQEGHRFSSGASEEMVHDWVAELNLNQ